MVMILNFIKDVYLTYWEISSSLGLHELPSLLSLVTFKELNENETNLTT